MKRYEIRYMRQVKKGIEAATDFINAEDARTAKDIITERPTTVSVTNIRSVRFGRPERRR
jgi:hypothetical protein